ncbi:hypothetical protein CDD81_1547 [Ophiocordyceps australis]|uniref:MADS-box MEF2 type transcription factor MIG1 n=1 Tax=Ophiocordyceps australis TaxID=1399860 RepID=A0A2C5XTH4_9HYPO|nr:hypothetical protein CDD81_1547 [Ophiocordyceps australis]
MGRRKIEIKAIKDDRNRSVTFLKRKGGLFKKAHELSVLCSVDVAVFIFGNNKKLYEYSSSDMRDLIQRYQVHGAVNERKGPADFNCGNDDDEDEDGDGTPPRGSDSMEHQMMPPHFHSQQPPFSQILRHHTSSASPPIGNGVSFQGHHAAHHNPRGVTPQPPMASRPSSRNDGRLRGPGMMTQPVSPRGAHPGITYMPTPPIYNPSTSHSAMMHQHSGQYSYPQGQHQPGQHQNQQQQHPPPPFGEDRRPSAPPGYSLQPPSTHAISVNSRSEPPVQPGPQAAARNHGPRHLSPPPQPGFGADRRPRDLPPPPVEPKRELSDRQQPPLLNTDTAIKKLPQRKSHSIFTPIEENRSILSQHLASFAAEPPATKSEVDVPLRNRSHSAEAQTWRDAAPQSPQLKRSSTQSSLDQPRNASLSAGPDATFTPPSRASSLMVGGPVGGARPRGPRLTVQIPDGASDAGSATGESNSPHNPAITPTQAPQRQSSHSSVVLPPPSPSASTLLSAGATGPPNPFARPPPQQTVNGETPLSALPSRFLNNEFLPSPSSFLPDWNLRGGDNTLPSPLNFATPVVGSGPSFLREENPANMANGGSGGNVNHTAASAAVSNSTMISGASGCSTASGVAKRKSLDHDTGQVDGQAVNEYKRLKV